MDWSTFFSGSPFGSMAPNLSGGGPQMGSSGGNPQMGGAMPGWQSSYMPAPAGGGATQPVNQMDGGAPAGALPGAPAPAPMAPPQAAPAAPPPGILNGAMGGPQQQPNANQNITNAANKLAAMFNPKPQQQQQMPQIQMPHPVGSGAGVDPRALIAAMMGRQG